MNEGKRQVIGKEEREKGFDIVMSREEGDK